MKKTLLLGALFAVVGTAQAQNPFTLVDGNSIVRGDADNGLLTDWETDGTDHLFNQDYYFRVGNTAERAVWSGVNGLVTTIAPNIVNVAYAHTGFMIDITYTLIGGTAGSGTSDIGEIVRIRNRSNGALDFHLFEYDDFDIGETAGGDFASLVNSSTIEQHEDPYYAMVGSTPPFDHFEISAWPNLLSKLTDNDADNLSDGALSAGPGDLAFGMQWDRTIAAGGTFVMSKNKRVETVPEPGTIAALGLGALVLMRRRRSK